MTTHDGVTTRAGGRSRLGVGATVALVGATAAAATLGRWKLVGIAWVAFLAMAVAAPLGARAGDADARSLVWGYGLASGAMVTSTAVFLVPQAIAHHPQYGGFGVAAGVLAGFGAHAVGHRLSHVDAPVDLTSAELAAHAVAAGLVLGVVYGNLPALGPTFGLAVVSHKAPAGYAAAGRLAREGRDWSVLLLPAAGVGIAAVVASGVGAPAGLGRRLALPAGPARGAVFGFAGGVLLHVAMDFLPRCEVGSDVHDALTVEGDAHALLDRLRLHAVASTGFGGLAVLLAWLAVSVTA